MLWEFQAQSVPAALLPEYHDVQNQKVKTVVPPFANLSLSSRMMRSADFLPMPFIFSNATVFPEAIAFAQFIRQHSRQHHSCRRCSNPVYIVSAVGINFFQ